MLLRPAWAEKRAFCFCYRQEPFRRVFCCASGTPRFSITARFRISPGCLKIFLVGFLGWLAPSCIFPSDLPVKIEPSNKTQNSVSCWAASETFFFDFWLAALIAQKNNFLPQTIAAHISAAAIAFRPRIRPSYLDIFLLLRSASAHLPFDRFTRLSCISRHPINICLPAQTGRLEQRRPCAPCSVASSPNSGGHQVLCSTCKSAPANLPMHLENTPAHFPRRVRASSVASRPGFGRGPAHLGG